MSKAKRNGFTILLAAALSFIFAAFLCLGFPMAEVRAEEKTVTGAAEFLVAMAYGKSGDTVKLGAGITVDLTDEDFVGEVYPGNPDPNKDLVLKAEEGTSLDLTVDLNGNTLEIITGSDKSCLTLIGEVALKVVDTSADGDGKVIGHSNGNLFYGDANSALVLESVDVEFTDAADITVAKPAIYTEGSVSLSDVNYASSNAAEASLIGTESLADGTYVYSDGSNYYVGGEEILAQTGVVAAIEQTNEAYTSLQEAIDEASAGSTVTLIADAVCEDDGLIQSNGGCFISVPADKDITLDLNGKAIKVIPQESSGAYRDYTVLYNTGTLTIADSSSEKTGTMLVDDKSVSRIILNIIANAGTLNIEGGNYNGQCPFANGGTLNIYSGNFFNTRDASETIAIACAEGTINILKNDKGLPEPVFTNVAFTYANEIETSAVINIECGTIIGADAQQIDPDLTMDKVFLAFYYGDYANQNLQFNVTGGTFEGGIVLGDNLSSAPESEDIQFSGGTFSEPVPAEYLAEGFTLAADGDGFSVLTEETVADYMAYITGEDGTAIYYETLQEAVEAAVAGDTIVLAKDIEATGSVINKTNLDAQITIDLNGHTIKSSNQNAAVFTIYTAESLTITSSQEGGAMEAAYALYLRPRESGITITVENIAISGEISFSSPIQISRYSTAEAKAVLSNVTVDYDHAAGSARTAAIYVSNIAELEINDSTIEVTDAATNRNTAFYAVELYASTAEFNGGSIAAEGDLSRAIYSRNYGQTPSVVTLNGTTVSGQDRAIYSYYSTLALNGAAVSAVNNAAVHGEGSDITIDGGSISSEKGPGIVFLGGIVLEEAADLLAADNTASFKTLELGGGVTVTGYTFAVSGNGSAKEVEPYSGTIINVRDASLTGNTAHGVYQPQVGILNVYDGAVISGASGIEIRAGELYVSGGTITGTSSELVISDAAAGGGGGTSINGAAIAISQHSTNKPVFVSITGGNLTGPAALYEEDVLNETANDTINAAVSGGTFTSTQEGMTSVSSENMEGFVSGGEFNRDMPETYIAGESLLYPQADGGYTVGNYDELDEVLSGGRYIAMGNKVYESLETAIAEGAVAVAPVTNSDSQTAYRTLQEAIDASDNFNNAITLLDDINEDIRVEGKSVEIDLNGHTITGVADHTIYIAQSGNLSLVDSSESGTGTVIASVSGKAALYNDGSVTVGMEGGEITFMRADGTTWYTIVNDGQMNLYNAIARNENSDDSSSVVINNLSLARGSSAAILNIYGGEYYSANATCVKNDEYGRLYIEGAEIRTDNNSGYYGLLSYGDLTIDKNGTYGDSYIYGKRYALGIGNVAESVVSTTEIYGGTFEAGNVNFGVALQLISQDASNQGNFNIVIEDGEFIGGRDAISVFGSFNNTVGTCTVTINDGYFENRIRIASGADGTIYGGEFGTAVSSSYLAEGVIRYPVEGGYAVGTEDVAVEAGAVAVNEETGIAYTNLQEAINNASDGDTIKLLQSITVDTAATGHPQGYTKIGLYISQKSLTIEGNGKTIRSSAVSCLFHIIGDYNADANVDIGMITVTLRDLTLVSSGSSYRPLETSGGNITLNLENVMLDNTDTTVASSSTLSVGGNSTCGSSALPVNVNISGSILTAMESGHAFVAFNPVTLTISGSELSGYSALWFDGQHSSFGSRGSVVTVENSTLTATNSFSGKSDFAAVVLDDSNIEVTLTDSDVNVIANGASKQATVMYGADDSSLAVKGSSTVLLSGSNALHSMYRSGTVSDLSSIVYTLGAGVKTNVLTADVAENSVIYYDEAQKVYVVVGEENAAGAGVVALNGVVGYTDLAEAFAEAKDGDTIMLIQDVTLEGERIEIGDINNAAAEAREITFDLNGQTLFIGNVAYDYGGADENFNTAALYLGYNTTLNIIDGSEEGTGTIDAQNADDLTVPVGAMRAGSVLNISGGTIIVDTPNESCVFAMNGGKINISGGTFTNLSEEDYAWGGGDPLVVNVDNSTSDYTDLVITGGTFNGRNPALGDDNMGGYFIGENVVMGYDGESGSYTVYEDADAAADAGADAVYTVEDGGVVAIVYSAAGFNEAMNGTYDVIRLGKDFTFTNYVVIRRSMTFDLGGYTLGATTGTVLYAIGPAEGESNSIRVINGTIESSRAAGTAVVVYGNADVQFENITIDSQYGDGSRGMQVGIVAEGYEACITKVTLVDTEINAKEVGVFVCGTTDESNPITLIAYDSRINATVFGICGNGSEGYQNTCIELYDTDVKADSGNAATEDWDNMGLGIYHPQKGTLLIDGGSVTGVASAIEIRSGALTVQGGAVLTATAEKFHITPNPGGTTTVGAAVAVSQHTTNNPIQVNISDAVLNGVYALYEDDVQDPAVGDVAMTVTGGTYNGGVHSENVAAFIAGGTFSELPLADYMAESYAFVAQEDGTYKAVSTGSDDYLDCVAGVSMNDTYVAYTSLQEAIASVPADGTEATITLLKDIDVTSNDSGTTIWDVPVKVLIESGKNITLDFNDHTIKMTEESEVIAIGVQGSLTLIDSGDNGGISTASNELTSGYAVMAGGSNAAITIYEGNYFGGVAVCVVDGAKGTIYGGNFYGEGMAVGLVSAELTIYGGTFTSTESNIYTVYVSDNAKLSVLASEDSDGPTILNGAIQADRSVVTIECGTFGNRRGGNTVLAMAGTTLNISGGEFLNDGSFETIYLRGYNRQEVVANISGGTFEGSLEINEYADYNITGGTFTEPVPQDYLEGGYSLTVSTDGDTTTYGVENEEAEAVVTRGETEYRFASFTDALAFAEDGDTVTLSIDVELAETLTIDNAIALDLNDCTITSAADVAVRITADATLEGGTLIAADGAQAVTVDGAVVEFNEITVTGGAPEATENLYFIEITNGSDVTFNGSTVKFTYAYAESVNPDAPPQGQVIRSLASDLTIVNSTITSDDYGVTFRGSMTDEEAVAADASEYKTLTITDSTIQARLFAVSGNGSGTNHGTNIAVTGSSKLESTEAQAIYHPQYGTLNISLADDETQAYIKGTAGIEMRAGSLTVESGYIEATGEFASGPQGGGSTTDGAAIAIVQHTTQLPISVELNGGKYVGDYAVYEYNQQGNPDEAIEDISLSVTGGTYEGDLSSQNLTGFISGGKFAVQPADDYFDENYAPQFYDGYFIVVKSTALAEAKYAAQTDIRMYAVQLGIDWSALADDESEAAKALVAAYDAIEEATSTLGVAKAKAAAFEAADAYAKAVKEEFEKYKADKLGELAAALAGEDGTEDDVVLPTATWFALNNAETKAEFDEYLDNALAEAEAIRAYRTAIAEQTAQLTDLAETLASFESNMGVEFGQLLTDIQGALEEAQAAIVGGDGSDSLASIQDYLENTIKTTLDSISGTLNTVAGDVASVKTTLENLDVSAELKEEFDALAKAIADAQAAINSNTGTELDAAIEEINQATADAVAGLRAELVGEDGASGVLGELADAVGALNGLLTEGDNSLAAIVADIEAAKDAILGTASGEGVAATGLQAVLEAVNGVSSSIDEAMAGINSALESLSAGVAAVQTTIDELNLSEQFAAVEQAIADAQTAINSNTTSAVNGAVTQLKDAISAAQSEIIAAIPDYTETLTAISGYVDGLESLLEGENGLAAIKGDIDSVLAALGTATDSDTLFGLLEAIQSGNAAIQSAVDELQTTLTGTNGAIEELQTDLTAALAQLDTLTGALETNSASIEEDIAAAKTEIDKIVAAIGSLGTGEGNDLATQIGEIVTALEDVQGTVGSIAESVDASTTVETAKDNALADIEAWINEYLDNILGVADEADSGTVVALAFTAETTDGDIYAKLAQAFSEENAQLVLKYYNDALAAIDAATTVSEVTTAVSTFKAQVASVEAAAQNAANVNLTGVYVLLAILLVAVAAAIVAVLLKKNRQAAEQTAAPAEAPAPAPVPEPAPAAAAEEIAVDDDKERVVIAANVRSFSEAYVDLSEESRELFNKVREYALAKENAVEVKQSTGVCVKRDGKQIVKLTVRRGAPVALFFLENEMLKDFRRERNSKSKLKVHATELILREEEDLEAAYRMVDLSLEQIDKDIEAKKARIREMRRLRKQQKAEQERNDSNRT